MITKKERELNKKGLCIHCKKPLQKDIDKHNKEQLKLGYEFNWERLIKGRGECDSCLKKHCMD